MKKFACILLGLTSLLILRAETVKGEGWYDTSAQNRGIQISNPVSISRGSGNIGEPFPIGISDNKVAPRMMSLTNESANADLVNLATMLDNDPNKIIEYVRTNIKTGIYYGVKKGAMMTLYEKSGNDYDKCVLTKALIEAANTDYTFCFVKSLDLIPIKRMSSNSRIMSLADMFGIDADLDVVANEQTLLVKLLETRIPFRRENVEIDGSVIKCVRMPRYKV